MTGEKGLSSTGSEHSEVEELDSREDPKSWWPFLDAERRWSNSGAEKCLCETEDSWPASVCQAGDPL